MAEPITFVVWTDNSPGVLLRLTTLFTRRKINIESLTVSATEEPGISRFTVVVVVESSIAATLGRQIERMIEVQRVFVLADSDVVHREVALVRAHVTPEDESAMGDKFSGCKILERGERGVLLEVTGTEGEISAVLEFLTPYGVTEFVRSGRIALAHQRDMIEISLPQ